MMQDQQLPEWMRQSQPLQATGISGGIPNVAMAKPKGGMFGGGSLKGIAGMIGDFLLQRSGMAPIYTPALQMNQRRQAEQEEYQQRRNDQFEDWKRQQEFKLANPSAPNNDTVADYQFIAQSLGPEAAKRFLETKTNPIVMTPYGPMPYSQVAPQAPTAPVGRLTPIDGGPAPQAPGGFRYP